VEIKSLVGDHIPIAIVTRGSKSDFGQYQIDKVKFCDIKHEELFVSYLVGAKVSAIRSLLSQYGSPLLFVDDDQSELDSVREEGLNEEQVITVHVNRPDSPNVGKKSKFRHHQIESFTDFFPFQYRIAPTSTLIRVRPAIETDLPTIADINARVFLGNRERPEAAVRWVKALFAAHPIYQYFVIELDDVVRGYVGWQQHGGFMRAEPVIELEQLGIDPNFQGRKLSDKLVDQSLQQIIEEVRRTNDRIESHITVLVWSYALNLNAIACTRRSSLTALLDSVRCTGAGRRTCSVSVYHSFAQFVTKISKLNKGDKQETERRCILSLFYCFSLGTILH
jgi:GNAT superfamily N-acetyltransferase